MPKSYAYLLLQIDTDRMEITGWAFYSAPRAGLTTMRGSDHAELMRFEGEDFASAKAAGLGHVGHHLGTRTMLAAYIERFGMPR